MSLFKKAKKTQTKKTTTTTEKASIIPTFDSKAEKKVFHAEMVKFAKLKTEKAVLEAQMKSLDASIKEVGMAQFVKNVEATGKRDTSYILGTEKGASVMVTVQDKYKMINEERAEYLNETYGTFNEDEELIDGIVDENTTYGFNKSVLERNSDIISDLIENCGEISDTDKANLIEATTKYTVKKGTIEKVYKLSQDLKIDLEVLIEEISPVIALKNPTAPEEKTKE